MTDQTFRITQQGIKEAAAQIDKEVLRYATREIEANPFNFITDILAAHCQVEAPPPPFEVNADFRSTDKAWLMFADREYRVTYEQVVDILDSLLFLKKRFEEASPVDHSSQVEAPPQISLALISETIHAMDLHATIMRRLHEVAEASPVDVPQSKEGATGASLEGEREK